MSDDGIRDDLPAEVYASRADYVRLAFKETTAHRMVGWLRDAAEVYDIGGAEKSAEHCRALADMLESELPEDKFAPGSENDE
jgi:Arc/MetJ-type ribon-helix-helix transcriptional regulator